MPVTISGTTGIVDQDGGQVLSTTSLASQAEATAGTDNTKIMTPLRVAEAISSLPTQIATQVEAEAGTDNTKIMTPLRVSQAVNVKTFTNKLVVSLNTVTPVYSTGHMELRTTDSSAVSLGFHRSGFTACQLRHASDGLVLSGTSQTAEASFIATGNVGAYSDVRLKSNIRTIDNALDKVSNMRGVYFDKAGKASVGVIAQEMETVLPEVVFDGEYKSVGYGNIVGVLIEAIKELKAEIEELKKSK